VNGENIRSIKDCSSCWRKEYNNPGFKHLNSLTKLKIQSGYFIDSSDTCIIDISGEPVSLFNYKLNPGWNLISYPFEQSRGFEEWRNIHGYTAPLSAKEWLADDTDGYTDFGQPSDLRSSVGYFVDGGGLENIIMNCTVKHVSVRLGPSSTTTGRRDVEIRPNDCSNIIAYLTTFTPKSTYLLDLDLSGGNLSSDKYTTDCCGLPIYYNDSSGIVLAIPYNEHGIKNVTPVVYDASASDARYVTLFNINENWDLDADKIIFIDESGFDVSAIPTTTTS